MALTDGLRAYWTLNEPSGIRRDSVGSSNLLQTGVVSSAAGLLGNAAVFNSNVANYLECASNADLSMGDVDFTVAGWFKITNVGTGQNPVAKGTATTAANLEYLFLLTASSLQFRVSDGVTSHTAQVSVLGLDGTWIFVAGLHNSATDEIFARVNSTLSAGTAHSGGAQLGGNDFRLGNRGGTSPMGGMIDDLGIWGRVLSTAELNELYNNGAGVSLFNTRIATDGKSF